MTTTNHLRPGSAGGKPSQLADSPYSAREGSRAVPTRHAQLLAWIDEVAALTTPDAVHWVDGSEDENRQLLDQLVAAGTFVPLTKKPDSYWCASEPSDVARVEDSTFICSLDEADAGPTNNWMDPAGCGPS